MDVNIILDVMSDKEYMKVDEVAKIINKGNRMVRKTKADNNKLFFKGKSNYFIMSGDEGYKKVHKSKIKDKEVRIELERTYYKYLYEAVTMIGIANDISKMIDTNINQQYLKEIFEEIQEEKNDNI